MSLEQLVIYLVECRDAAKKAHADLVAKAVEVGDCTDNREGQKCWARRGAELCDACAVKTPLWKAWRKASAKSGAVLRRVISAGRHLQRCILNDED